MFVQIIFLFVFFVLCAGDIKDETEDRLLKFRDDINQISLDFENFIYDIVKESLAGSDMIVNAVHSDPNARANSLLKALSPTGRNVLGRKPTDFKDILNKYVKGDVLPTTPKNLVDNVLDNYMEKTASLLSRNGLKRSRRDALVPGMVDSRNSNADNDKTDECSQRIQQEKFLEHQHIEELKEEVRKLHDLVILLKDQQKIMTILDDDPTQDSQSSDMLKILDNFKKNDTGDRIDIKPGILEPIPEATYGEIKPTHEELEKIKYDLKQTISALNRTRDILINERDRELVVENELKRQKLQLNILKLMVEKLYKNNTLFEYQPINSSSTQDDIVGASVHHPKFLPKSRTKNTTRSSTGFNFRRRNDGISPRANELDDLLKQLDKKNREENIKKLLAKLLEEKESKTLETKSDDIELIKKLQLALELMSKPQSKGDDDIESELKKLENAINSLKPKEPSDFGDSSEDIAKLRDLLNGLNGQSGRDLPNAGGSGNRGLSQQQINELRKKLQQMSTSNTDGKEFPGTNNYGYGQQNSDMAKRGYGWNQYSPYPEGYGNYPPPPYGNFYGPPPNGYGLAPPQIPPPNPYPGDGYGAYSAGHQFPPNYGGGADNPNYGPKPYGQPYEGNPPYGPNPGPADYGKQYGVYGGAQKPLPYASGGSSSPSYPPADAGSHFFPSSQPNAYDKSVSDSVYPPDGADGSHSGQSAPYLSKNPYGVDYKTKNIEELKTQIGSLQNVINSLSYSGYAKKPEDQETIASLEQQINELKGVINSLSQDASSSQATYNAPPSPSSYPQAAAGYNQNPPSYGQNPPAYNQNQPNFDQHANAPQPSYTSSRRKRSIDDSGNNTDSQLFDQLIVKVKDYLFKEESPEGKSAYQDVQSRINNLKTQLDHLDSPSERRFEPRSFESYQPPGYYQNYYYPPTTPPKIKPFSLVPPKKQDVFNTVVAKILDKIIGAIPTVLERIFGSTVYHLVNFNDPYDYSYGKETGYYGNQYGLANLFKSFGVLGWFPLIILKIIDGITTFVHILKKNKFFKNFLLPALLLLVIAGAVVFLIWWMQPDDYYYKQIGYDKQNSYSNYNYNPNSNYNYNPNPNDYNNYKSKSSYKRNYGNNNNYNNRYEIDNYNRNMNGPPAMYSSYFEN